MRRKAKKKRALSLDFVTALTVAECRDTLQTESERFVGVGRQAAVFGDEGYFCVKRTFRLGVVVPLRLEFEGTLTEVAAGTRVKGQINAATLARIQRRRRWMRVGQSVFIALYVLATIVTTAHDPTVFVIRYGLYLAIFVGWAMVSSKTVQRAPEQVVNWLHKYLDYPLELHPLEGDSGDDHESQAKSEAETRAAAEPGLRDRAHAG